MTDIFVGILLVGGLIGGGILLNRHLAPYRKIRCEMCMERVFQGARKCPHCGASLDVAGGGNSGASTTR